MLVPDCDPAIAATLGFVAGVAFLWLLGGFEEERPPRPRPPRRPPPVVHFPDF